MDLLNIFYGLGIAAISSAVTIYINKRSYKNTYHQKIIDKRLDAAEKISSAIALLNVTTGERDLSSPDGAVKQFHYIFAFDHEQFTKYTHDIFGNINNTYLFWMSEETRAAFLNLNREFTKCSLLHLEDNLTLKEIGHQEYINIAKLRDALERAMLNELPSLYDIDTFFKQKSVVTTFNRHNLKQ